MKTVEINANNVGDLNFYNLVQMCRLTRYADPIGAFKAKRETILVSIDDCGNIIGRANTAETTGRL